MLKQMISALLLACVGAATVHRIAHAHLATGAPVTVPARSTQPRRPTAYGINLTSVAFWQHDRAFMNLMAGGGWVEETPHGWPDLDPARIDREGTVASLQPGEMTASVMSFPPDAFLRDVPVHCTFEGRGEITIFPGPVPKVGRGTLDFVWPKGQTTSISLHRIDPADPIRHIDCREAGADRNALFDPRFVDSLRPYKVVRFQFWEEVNQNNQVSWDKRTLPNSIFQESSQGVAVENMVALANQAHVDPWFNLPWNGDDTYMANFARMVHDRLDHDRKVYVEVGNETWNYAFPLASQVLKEGRDEQLSPDGNVARMARYAERSVHVFKIWQEAFGADRGRIVRVLAGQAVWPDLLKLALDYRDTARQVDVIAMAPYFGFDFLQKTTVDLHDTDGLFRAMPSAVDEAIGFMKQDKALADHYGLRLVTYEAGTHLLYNGPDQTLMARLNRDPRMADMYRRYLAGWDREAGDLITMFVNNSPIAPGSAFGMAEYPSQPMSETPKRRAVLEAIAAHR